MIRLPINTGKRLGSHQNTDNTDKNVLGANRLTDELHLLSISIDQLRLSSSYLDTSCLAPLSIHVTNVIINYPTGNKDSLPIKIGSLELPMNKIRGDFLNYQRNNFNITINDISIILDNFSYRIEKLNANRSTNGSYEDGVASLNYQRIQQVDLNRVIFNDLNIPETDKRQSSSIETPDELTKQRIFFIEHVQLTHQFITGYNSKNNSVINVAINGDSFLQWNLQFHLNLIKLINYFKSHESAKEDVQYSSSKTQESKPDQAGNPTNLKLSLDGRVKIGVLISDDQTICINTESLDINAHFPGPKTLRSKALNVDFDEHTIITCALASVSHYQSPGITCILDRNQSNCNIKLADQENSLLSVEMESLDFHFPYKYNFADAFNMKFMAIVKWLKLFHKNPSRYPTRNPPFKDLGLIDFDISIRINRFSFSMGDDPFEMKLRNNYMLLEEEYNEQLKRDQTLQDKLNQLKKTNLMLASSIVEDLIKALAKKNSDIYIQRSKQLYASNAKQAPLFNVIIEEADLKILADSSFHQHSDIKNIIKANNPDAPLIDDIQFITIFCRIISSNFKSVEIYLRDFPIPMLSIRDFTIKGQLVATEQMAAPRARRTCQVYMGHQKAVPVWVERSMTPLKIFHNLQLRCTSANYTHGPCWDPILAQVSISFEDIIPTSADPSPSLPWWDKMRFVIHGQVKLNCNHFSVVLHASNDPYNETEMIELTLARSLIDWNGNRIKIKGDFEILLHTASRYDECRIIHIPNLELTVNLEWLCLGNPNDHHSIMPCAPDKVPDYSSHQNHDSYRSFRSQNLNCSFNFETQFTSPTSSLNPENMPSMLVFGSTIRWLENQKFIFVGPTKLTRRGVLFNNTAARKIALSRLFKNIRLTINLNRIQILYWSSVSKRHGIQIIGGELLHSSEHQLKLYNNNSDGLLHRSQCDWQSVFMKSDLINVDLWLYNLSHEDLNEFNEFNVQHNLKNRQYFISFSRFSYDRVSQTKPKQQDCDSLHDESAHQANNMIYDELDNSSELAPDELVPNHRLVIHDLKAAWTKDNRDVVTGIFDAFMNSLQLKRNLSTDALKPIRKDAPSHNHANNQATNISSSSSQGAHHSYQRHQRNPSTTSLINSNITMMNNVLSISNSRAVSMLQKLIADSENNPTVYTEESHSGVASETHLYGVEACQMDDVVGVNCLIELVNSQVVLCGTETPGYVIVSAATTEIRQATHLPVWKNRTLLSKTTWIGSLKCMQYYATVDSHVTSNNSRRIFTHKNDIQWLDPDDIDSRSIIKDYPDIVGSGHSVGGVVSSVVGKLGQLESGEMDGLEDQGPIQLQRIISRCDCQFYYASHAAGVSEHLQHLIPPLPEDDMFIEPWDKEVGVDSFTMTHQDLEISTNSQQYAMIFDIINNLLLFVESHKKTAFEKLERMRFRFQLSADEDQRVPISQLQDQVRRYVAYLKRLERERYLVYRASIDESAMLECDRDNRLSLDTLSTEIQTVKEQLTSASEELAMMISCYKEMQLGAHKAQKQQAASQAGIGAFFANVIRRNEICFQSARWRVTDSDGQLGLADIVLKNFLYSEVVKSDDSVEHTIELGHLRVSNLIPNQAYKDVLHPTELQANIPLDRQRALRVYCRELAPVGGIPVKEHLELNVVPFTIEITLQFFQKMVKFFFPERDQVKDQEKTSKRGSTYGSSNQRLGEEIEKMRERASKNHTFVYVKIPGIPIKVSYKGKKQKNVTDLKNICLTLPTFEYHNSTWTWLDLLMAVKNDSKHTVIKQALKQKMKIRPSSIWSKNSSSSNQSNGQPINNNASGNTHIINSGNHDTASLSTMDSTGSQTSTREDKDKNNDFPVTDEEKARLLLGPYAKSPKK